MGGGVGIGRCTGWYMFCNALYLRVKSLIVSVLLVMILQMIAARAGLFCNSVIIKSTVVSSSDIAGYFAAIILCRIDVYCRM